MGVEKGLRQNRWKKVPKWEFVQEPGIRKLRVK
jgi:hypothetical protein